MKRVQLDAEAKQELTETFRWYEARRLGLGFDFLEEVESIFLLLEESPSRGARVPGTDRACFRESPGLPRTCNNARLTAWAAAWAAGRCLPYPPAG